MLLFQFHPHISFVKRLNLPRTTSCAEQFIRIVPICCYSPNNEALQTEPNYYIRHCSVIYVAVNLQCSQQLWPALDSPKCLLSIGRENIDLLNLLGKIWFHLKTNVEFKWWLIFTLKFSYCNHFIYLPMYCYIIIIIIIIISACIEKNRDCNIGQVLAPKILIIFVKGRNWQGCQRICAVSQYRWQMMSIFPMMKRCI